MLVRRSGWAMAMFGLAACGGPEPLAGGPPVEPPPVEDETCRMHCVTHVVQGGETGYVDGPVEIARFQLPRDIAMAPTGELYVIDTYANAVRVIEKGEVRTFAGSRETGFVDGRLHEARFAAPAGIAVDVDGAIYVADTNNHRIRKIHNGVVSTYAGTGEPGYRDGDVSEALFSKPVDVDVDSAGNVYVVEFDNYTIRKISTRLEVTTLAGGPTNLDVARPRFVAVGPSGAVYFTDGERNLIRKIYRGVLSTLSGCVFAGHVDGDRQIARFENPTGIAVDALERVFVSDTGNRRIRMIDGDEVYSVAGTGFIGDMDGQADMADIVQPVGITTGYDGALYVTELQFVSVRRIELE